MSTDAQSSGRLDEQIVTAVVGFEVAATLRLVARGTGRKAIPRRVERVRNLGWAVTLPVTKRTGVALFVPRSRLALRSVRFAHDSKTRRHRVMRRRRLVTFVHL